jgi:ABC-type methionine transport system ATPase subunit
MSRDLGMDFKIINSEMSQYRDKYLGYLIINFSERKDEVEAYLNTKNVIWRYYE